MSFESFKAWDITVKCACIESFSLYCCAFVTFVIKLLQKVTIVSLQYERDLIVEPMLGYAVKPFTSSDLGTSWIVL